MRIKKKFFGNLDDDIDFSKDLIQHEEHFVLVDKSTLVILEYLI